MSQTRITIDRRYHDAAIFDLDDVVTDTGSVHAAAWKELLDGFLAGRTDRDGEDHSPVTEDEYRRLVAGRFRYDDVAGLLTARGIPLAPGSPADLTEDTVCGLGNREQAIFVRLLGGGVPAFHSTIALARRLHEVGIASAVYSASHDCEQILRAAGVGELFDVRVDGVGAAEGAALAAAGRLGVRPDRCVVIASTETGVRADRDGGFGLVIGIDRSGHPGPLCLAARTPSSLISRR